MSAHAARHIVIIGGGFSGTMASVNLARLSRVPLRVTLVNHAYPPGRGIALLVGPEGGLADAELQQAAAAGFIATQLGPRILRTETAGLAALAALQAMSGDFAAAENARS